MKGQYRIISEVLLFGIGIGIAILVLTTYQSLNKSIGKLTFYDQLEEVSNFVTASVVKVSQTSGDSWLILEIPEKLSGREYKIILDNKTYSVAYLIVSDYRNSNIQVQKQLFNMTNDNIDYGEVLSTARYINISRCSGKIRIKRCEYEE